MKIVKICGDVWKNASRDKRELSVYREMGAEVSVVAKGWGRDRLRGDMIDGYRVLRCTTRPLGEMVPNMLNRLASLLTWASAVRTLHADAITGENLTGTFIGWLSNLGVASKAALIYDSHEFEIGRSGERSRAAKWLVTHLERFLMKRCAFSIMVNDSIADEVQRIHRLKQRPVVVRNIPPLWMRDDAACAQVRREFCAALHMQEDTFLVMYHGGVMPNRGVENMLRAVALTPGVAGVVLGNGDADYVASLKKLAGELGVGERILFHPAVPVEILKDYVGAADCGLVMMINDKMPEYCVDRAARVLNGHQKALSGARVLVLGVAYKQDIDDCRESPAIRVIEELQKHGAAVQYYDPFIKSFRRGTLRMDSEAELTAVLLESVDLVIVTTAHTCVDYGFVQQHAQAIFDTKNAMKNVTPRGNIEVL